MHKFDWERVKNECLNMGVIFHTKPIFVSMPAYRQVRIEQCSSVVHPVLILKNKQR